MRNFLLCTLVAISATLLSYHAAQEVVPQYALMGTWYLFVSLALGMCAFAAAIGAFGHAYDA